MTFQEKAKIAAARAMNDWFKLNQDQVYDKDTWLNKDDMFIVWFSKTLQNWKAIISTDMVKGYMVEVTYNGNRKEIYCDIYKKMLNKAYSNAEIG